MTRFARSPVGALFGAPGHGYEDLTTERFPSSQYIMVGAGLMGLLAAARTAAVMATFEGVTAITAQATCPHGHGGPRARTGGPGAVGR
ncbi:hypothetical protein [Actinokineospora pegani]|uniref:hypothetical protein n=1 Tax=Actinokineospora pegani TaxID=2654637 RepID=UPI0012EAABF2|nr:hypothetical protein [Actinokineospora pegani]